MPCLQMPTKPRDSNRSANPTPSSTQQKRFRKSLVYLRHGYSNLPRRRRFQKFSTMVRRTGVSSTSKSILQNTSRTITSLNGIPFRTWWRSLIWPLLQSIALCRSSTSLKRRLRRRFTKASNTWMQPRVSMNHRRKSSTRWKKPYSTLAWQRTKSTNMPRKLRCPSTWKVASYSWTNASSMQLWPLHLYDTHYSFGWKSVNHILTFSPASHLVLLCRVSIIISNSNIHQFIITFQLWVLYIH